MGAFSPSSLTVDSTKSIAATSRIRITHDYAHHERKGCSRLQKTKHLSRDALPTWMPLPNPKDTSTSPLSKSARRRSPRPNQDWKTPKDPHRTPRPLQCMMVVVSHQAKKVVRACPSPRPLLRPMIRRREESGKLRGVLPCISPGEKSTHTYIYSRFDVKAIGETTRT